MEKFFYNILWIDDEHEMLTGLKGRAKYNGINLVPFKSLNSGMNELERNFTFYDGVLLDAKFFENEDDVKGSEDTSNVHRAKDRLLQLKKKFEVFVLTGQAEAYENKEFQKAFTKVYSKGSDQEIESLFSDIKVASATQEDTQIRHKYHRVFDVCVEKYIGENAYHDLLSILKKENFEYAFTDPNLYFNLLRKIMDDLFIALNRYGLMPDVFVKPSVALNESSKFLSGIVEKGYKLEAPIFPKVVSDHVRSILAVCQPAAHRSEIDSFITEVNSPYLLLSVTYQVLDVLLWFKGFVDANSDVELNKSKYRTIDLGITSSIVTGTVEQDEKGNFHCAEFILTYKHINEMGYKVGDTIRIIKEVNNTNEKTMHLYPKSVLQTEKI
ncbi:hypothetical protein V7S76_09730 [Aquirufa sp. ROCK2-A2]